MLNKRWGGYLRSTHDFSSYATFNSRGLQVLKMYLQHKTPFHLLWRSSFPRTSSFLALQAQPITTRPPGAYSVRATAGMPSAWNLLRSRAPTCHCSKVVWHSCLQPMIAFFCWRLCHKSSPTSLLSGCGVSWASIWPLLRPALFVVLWSKQSEISFLFSKSHLVCHLLIFVRDRIWFSVLSWVL